MRLVRTLFLTSMFACGGEVASPKEPEIAWETDDAGRKPLTVGLSIQGLAQPWELIVYNASSTDYGRGENIGAKEKRVKAKNGDVLILDAVYVSLPGRVLTPEMTYRLTVQMDGRSFMVKDESPCKMIIDSILEDDVGTPWVIQCVVQ